MSKKLANEKEIEKARVERKWKTVVALVSALNVKNAGGGLSSEEVELFCCLNLGEAELESTLEKHFHSWKPHELGISGDELKQAFSYLSAAVTASKKSRDRHPHLYRESHLLMSKYHYVIGNYQSCMDYFNSVEMKNPEALSKRGKIILAEALTCKALALEVLNKGSTVDKEILSSYEMAGEIALTICIGEERSSTLKRSTTPTYVTANHLTPLFETCLLRPGSLLVLHGQTEDALQNYRYLLRAVETKASQGVRKVACQKLAQILLSFTSSSFYYPPTLNENTHSQSGSLSTTSTNNMASPDMPHSTPSFKIYKQGSFGEGLFCPQDEVEEAVLLLLVSGAMVSKNSVFKQTKDEIENRRALLNETNVIFDLLAFALTRREQYSLFSQSIEKFMKFAFEEFQLWFQFGLSLVCAGKYSRALLIFEQCHKLQPDNTDVLMFCVKLCINNLQQYEDGITYATRVLGIASNVHVEASARLAIGICYNQIAIKANSSGETQKLLKLALTSLTKAHDLDHNDTEILLHLALNQAFSKQLLVAVSTIKLALSLNPTDMSSLQLLVLLLSAKKKYHEALEVLETAIEEFPTEFSLLLTKVKLTEECYGSQAALVVCHGLLLLWNDMYNTKEDFSEVDNVPEELAKSPSFSMTKQSLTEFKLMDATAGLKKVTLADSNSMYDEDGSGSIVASIRIEKTLSEAAASGTITATSTMGISTAIALLSKLWLVTAECFINLGDTTEASGCILEASAIFPLSPDVLYMRGRLSELQNNTVEAKACYESAVSVLPRHKSAAQRLGLMYHDEGDLILAEKTLRDCILRDSSNHTAWNDLGLVLESSQRYEESADCFLTSLQLESSSPILPYTTIPRLFKAFDYS